MVSAQSREARFAVSVHLLRQSQVATAESLVRAAADAVYDLSNDIPGGKLYSFPATPAPPRWLSVVESLLPRGVSVPVMAQAPACLLWIPRGHRLFILTFGYAHALLKEEWLEPEFGKKVALSTIPPDNVVEVRAEQVFARRHVANERAPRASSFRAFGFQADRDLFSAVEGVPHAGYSDAFGEKVRGGASLKLGMRFSRLLETLDAIEERFVSEAYKKNWPNIDNLIVVRDAARSAALDAELDIVLSSAKPEQKISVAAPALRTGDSSYPQHFVVGRMRKNPATSPYLTFASWEGMLRATGKRPTAAAARATRVHLLDEALQEIDACSVYECFGAEVTHGGHPHILSSGLWYETRRQFVRDTHNTVTALRSPSYKLPAWNRIDDEAHYNAVVAAKDAAIWLFDRKLVPIGGGKSRLEFCDLMHLPTNTLYFVKQPSASAGLSHLCEQVRRTAENFFHADDAFRKRLMSNIQKEGKISNIKWLRCRPRRQDWNLCLVAMGKAASEFPFFAKCGVATLVRELEQSGYNVLFQAV